MKKVFLLATLFVALISSTMSTAQTVYSVEEDCWEYLSNDSYDSYMELSDGRYWYYGLNDFGSSPITTNIEITYSQYNAGINNTRVSGWTVDNNCSENYATLPLPEVDCEAWVTGPSYLLNKTIPGISTWNITTSSDSGCSIVEYVCDNPLQYSNAYVSINSSGVISVNYFGASNHAQHTYNFKVRSEDNVWSDLYGIDIHFSPTN